MAQLQLSKYLLEINELVEQEDYGQVILHCLNLLRQFPQHLEAYKLLGTAYLEVGRASDASDIFKRILSADPEDLIAQLALAHIARQEAQHQAAKWHIDRAYEIAPYNNVVIQERVDIYRDTGARVPEHGGIPAASIARQYIKNNVCEPAIELLIQLNQQDPERLDLQIMLAEAYWRAGHNSEALIWCKRFLPMLPNSLKGNAINGGCLLAIRPLATSEAVA